VLILILKLYVNAIFCDRAEGGTMKVEQRGTDDFRLDLDEYELQIICNALRTDLDTWAEGPFDFEGAHEIVHDTRQMVAALSGLLSPSPQPHPGPVLISERRQAQ
jgi:hypothetical protein